MEVTYPCCAGLDIHKKFVVACRRRVGPGGQVKREVARFLTHTGELEALARWLAEEGVTHVAMEATGVYWKPIWNVLDGQFTLLLVNAKQVKQVPGRKTDVSDAEWMAQLLQHGLLAGSFVPPRWQRELRDLTRARTKLADQKTGVVNRIHKVLEDANIKLGTVASDVLGVSGRAMLDAIVEGETDPHRLADLARRRLRSKLDALELALVGRLTEHHRFQLRLLLDQVDFLDQQIATLDARVAELSRPFEGVLLLLDTIPGIDRRLAEILLAELGPNMAVFFSAAALASWAGLCPGNNQTGGKQRASTTRKANRWVRRALTEAAWAASHTKNTYLATLYRRLAGRRGKKRAIVAVAHSIIVAIHHMLTTGELYQDLGPHHLDRLAPTQLTRYLVKRLECLGHKVTLEPVNQAA